MKTKEYFQIRYTDIDTGQRLTYMNIGFENKDSAINELRKIKDQKKKLNGVGYYLKKGNSFLKNRACLSGINFRIRKIIINQ